MMRLLKALSRLRPFAAMSTCIVNLVMVSKDVATLLLITIFFFATIGYQALGGRLYAECPVLQGTEYISNGYDALNFNTMGGSMETLFVMMVNSYMPAYAEALGLVLPYYWLGPLFCSMFF